MRFDANPPTVKALNERLRLDPRVLRSVRLLTKYSYRCLYLTHLCATHEQMDDIENWGQTS